jgi:hypothetical protein
MADLDHGGVRVGLPQGWEGEILERPQVQRETDPNGSLSVAESAPPLVTLHAANFALPPARGDYGSGAVETMPADGVFVALLEFGPDSVGTALFAQAGLPLPLDPAAFSPRQLQRPQAAQSGLQTFCTLSGRPFCVYVVIGNYLEVASLVAQATTILAGLHVS